MTWRKKLYDDPAVRTYFNLSGLPYSTAPSLGTAGSTYYVTAYGYDARGRPNRTVRPTGTIT